MSDEPREYTLAEVRAMFIAHCRRVAHYWAVHPDEKTPQERCDGVAFSILVALDGMAGGCVGFKLTPSFHPDDVEYHKKNGENWYPSEGDIREGVMMHDEYYREVSP